MWLRKNINKFHYATSVNLINSRALISYVWNVIFWFWNTVRYLLFSFFLRNVYFVSWIIMSPSRNSLSVHIFYTRLPSMRDARKFRCKNSRHLAINFFFCPRYILSCIETMGARAQDILSRALIRKFTVDLPTRSLKIQAKKWSCWSFWVCYLFFRYLSWK